MHDAAMDPPGHDRWCPAYEVPDFLVVGRVPGVEHVAVIVGECPHPRWSGDSRRVCTGGGWWRLADALFASAPRMRYLRTFERVNARQHPETAPSEAQDAAAGVAIMLLAAGRPIVACGRVAASVLGAGDADSPSETHFGCVIPHPSGRCRRWNDKAAREKCLRVVRRVVGLQET